MTRLRAVCWRALRFACAFATVTLMASAGPAQADFDKPWKAEDRALVIDAYEFNPIDWQALTDDKRIAGFINKASDGLPPEWNCRGKGGDEVLLCKNRWWKYSVTKELYMTRRAMAKTLGLKWGAYHLGRPGNPREQADHFIDFAEPAADDLIAIDIEDNTAEWMSLSDAEIFADQVKIRTGRYPVLYTNGSTAKWISDYKDKYRLLSRLPLWYARYRDNITGKFPLTTWPSYALWQFSSMHNCSQRNCPYRVKGAKTDIDVNVSPYDVAGLRAAWPFDQLVAPPAPPSDGDLFASLRARADRLVSDLADSLAPLVEVRRTAVSQVTASVPDTTPLDTAFVTSQKPIDPEPSAPLPPPSLLPMRHGPTAELQTAGGLLAAYGAAPVQPKRLDPLKLLTDIALSERAAAAAGKLAAGDAVKRHAEAVGATPKTVEVASLRPGNDMGDAMHEIAAIVPQMKRTAVTASSAPVVSWTREKSRIRQWLEAANAAKVQGSVLPAGGLSIEAAGERGIRPSAMLGPHWAETASVPIDRRVLTAFQATR